MKLLAELKRRNVFRVAVAYLVLSWLLLQVGDVLFETLELPASWNKGLLAILGLGLLPVLFFSWVYELTPDGLKREAQIEAGRSITAHTAKKLDVAVIVLLVLAIGLFAFERFMPRSQQSLSTPLSPESVVTKQPAERLRRLGRFEEMQLYLERVLELDPESALASISLSKALILQGKDAEALAQDDRNLARYPDNALVERERAVNRLDLIGDRATVLEVARR